MRLYDALDLNPSGNLQTLFGRTVIGTTHGSKALAIMNPVNPRSVQTAVRGPVPGYAGG